MVLDFEDRGIFSLGKYKSPVWPHDDNPTIPAEINIKGNSFFIILNIIFLIYAGFKFINKY